MAGRCRREAKGSVNLTRGGLTQDVMNVVYVDATTGHDHNTVSGGSNQVRQGMDCVHHPSFTCGGQYPRGAGVNDSFQTCVQILAKVKSTMESHRQGARLIHQLAGPPYIDSPVFI